MGDGIDGYDVSAVGEVSAAHEGDDLVVLMQDRDRAAFGGDVQPVGRLVAGEYVRCFAHRRGAGDLPGGQSTVSSVALASHATNASRCVESIANPWSFWHPGNGIRREMVCVAGSMTASSL